MKLVLLFFCAIFGILIFFLLLIVLSTIKLNIGRFDVSNIEKGKKNKLELNSLVFIEFYLLGIIKIAKIKITKGLVSKLNIKTDMSDLKKDAKIIKQLHLIKLIKKLKIKIEQIVLKAEIGTEDVIITSYLVAIISSLIRNNIWNYKSQEIIF